MKTSINGGNDTLGAKDQTCRVLGQVNAFQGKNITGGIGELGVPLIMGGPNIMWQVSTDQLSTTSTIPYRH